MSALLIAASTSAAPTGIDSWDLILRFVFASTLITTAARTSQLAALPANAAAILLGGPLLVVALAAISYIAVCLAAVSNKNNRLIRAAVAATGSMASLTLPPFWFFGAPSIIAMLACLPILIGGYRSLGAPRQRHVRRTVGAVAALIGVSTAAAAITLIPARSAAEMGVASAREAIDALARADQAAAAPLVTLAEEDLERADRSASRWWVRASRLIPVVGQHAATFNASSGPALHAVRAARDAIELLDAEQLRSDTGGIDIEMLRLLGLHLTTVELSLQKLQTVAATPSPWLIRPAAARLAEIRDDLDDTLAQVVTATDVLTTLPAVLGGDGPRRYLIAIATPAEARELGGIVANWVEIELDDGELVRAIHGRNTDLADRAEPLDDTTKYPERYLLYQPAHFPQNLTGTPDFPTAAEAMAEVYEAGSGRAIDGVVYLDPFVIAAMLELTGPLEFDELDEPLQADNALEFFLVGQYERFTDPFERIDFLGEVSSVAVERVFSLASPSPQQVVDVLGPVVRQGRLLFWSFDPEARAVISPLGISGRFSPDAGGDFLSLVHANGAATKLDTFLHRSADYHISVEPETGRLTGTVEVKLSNSATADLPGYVLGEPGSTDISVLLSLYTHHRVVAASIEGQRQSPEIQVEYGLARYLVLAVVSPGTPVTVTFELEGFVDLTGNAYVLEIDHQPLVNDDEMTVSVALSDGAWLPGPDFDTDGAEAVAKFELAQDKTLTVAFADP